MRVISSPLSFLSIVVFPALSSPLVVKVDIDCVIERISLLQEKNSHFLLFLPILAYDRKKSHSVVR